MHGARERERRHGARGRRRIHAKAILAVVTIAALAGTFARELQAPSLVQNGEPYIVQSTDIETAAAAVRRAGGSVTHELAIIDSVTAELTEDQVELLRRSDDVRRVWRDRIAELDVVTSLPEPPPE